jgi:hypothetical protein
MSQKLRGKPKPAFLVAKSFLQTCTAKDRLCTKVKLITFSVTTPLGYTEKSRGIATLILNLGIR